MGERTAFCGKYHLSSDVEKGRHVVCRNVVDENIVVRRRRLLWVDVANCTSYEAAHAAFKLLSGAGP